MKYPSLLLAGALGLIAAAPPTPPPPPPVITQTPAPSPSAGTVTPEPGASVAPGITPVPAGSPLPDSLDTMLGAPKNPPPNAKGTPAPPPDARKGLDGVWEVQIQRNDITEYTHFNIKQDGTTLTGVYMTHDNKKFPVAGSLDGQSVRLVVSLPDGSTILFEAKVDGTTDMLGMLTDSIERVPFTAAYRPKEKWSDNVNTTPGGMGGLGGSGGGGGGIPPR